MNVKTDNQQDMIDQLSGTLLQQLDARPDKDLRNTWAAMQSHQHPQCAPLQINRQQTPAEKVSCGSPFDFEQKLINNLDFLLSQLELENPTAPSLETGFGAGTVATVFGSILGLENADYPDMPSEYIPLREFDEFELPSSLAQAGLFPRIKEQIDCYKATTPSEMLISVPNLQGPFNIINTVVSSDLLIDIQDNSGCYHRLMQMITDVIIQAWELMTQWIGPDRLSPTPGFSYCIASIPSRCFLAECSCNLISPQWYSEYVLPYDQQIANHFGRLAFHPCAGRHVFESVLKHFPDLSYTEAGWIEHLDDATISAEKAVEALQGHDVMLYVREELRKGHEDRRISQLIDLAKTHGQMYLTFTGMYWKPEDDDLIVDLHRRMDSYYHN